MREYSILHAPLLSFFSRSLYQDVGRHWKGTCLLYLLLLLALCWIPIAAKMQVGLSRFIARDAPPIVKQIPAITIRKGQASIQEPQPYFIIDPESKKPLAVIDTTGELTSLEGTGAIVLLTKSTVIAKKSKAETRTWDISGVRDFYVDSEAITGWLEVGRRWLVIIFYPFALLFSYVYRIVQALLYAAIGMAFASMLGARLAYQTLIRLAIIATTPAIVLDTVCTLAGIDVPFWWVICFAIAMGYLFFAVKANAEPEPVQAAEPGVPSYPTEL